MSLILRLVTLNLFLLSYAAVSQSDGPDAVSVVTKMPS